ncbi:MAG: hypothetical protein H6867_05025 [Rhodospirillales bacterium]|nr:hypothetical protein [Rhodospirillales bacterium]MCB9994891.1 hypothetical protein [Rhodospirillales bacterium]
MPDDRFDIKSLMENDEKTDEIFCLALKHYVIRGEIVRCKLVHARNATRESVISESPISLSLAEKYTALWDNLMGAFCGSCLSDDDFNAIEQIIDRLPKAIKKIYDEMVELDEKLQKLIKEISHKKYADALKIVEKIQSKVAAYMGYDVKIYDAVDRKIIKEISV